MGNRAHDLAAVLRGMGTGAMEPVHGRLGSLRAPALLVAGESDLKFRRLAREMAAAIPRSRVAVVRDAGHAPHLEAPRGLAHAVKKFLEEQEEVADGHGAKGPRGPAE